MARRSPSRPAGPIVNWLGNPGEANLAVTQTVAPVPAAAGTRLNYTITVTNGGPAAAANVVLNPGAADWRDRRPRLDAAGLLRARFGRRCRARWARLRPAASVQATVSFLTAATGTLVHDGGRDELDAGLGHRQQQPHDRRGDRSGGRRASTCA